MTLDPFTAVTDAIVGGRSRDLLEVCSRLDESERTELDAARQAVAAAVAPTREELDPAGRMKTPARAEQVAALTLAALALGPPEPRGSRFRAAEAVEPDMIDAALRQRSPAWRRQWGEHWTDWIDWRHLRRLIRDGTLERPTHDYPRLLALALTAPWAEGGGGDRVYEALLDDPGLLADDVFLVFDAERTWNGHFRVPELWPPALLRLAAEGHLDRARLLRTTVESIRPHRTVGEIRCFAALHSKLRPTVDELAVLAPEYLRLLDVDAAPAVSLALSQLRRLHRAGSIAPDLLLERLEPAIGAPGSGLARRAVRLVGEVIARSPSARARGLAIVLPALAHDDLDTQTAVIDLLEGHRTSGLDLAALDGWRGHLDPALRARARRLIAGEGVGAAPARPPVALPDPAPLDPRAVDRLVSEYAVEPIADLDELLAVTAVVLERQDDPDELERWCEGVARLCDLPIDERRARPLRRRAARREPMPYTQSAFTAVATVAHHWLTREPVREIDSLFHRAHGLHLLRADRGPAAALNRRLVVLADRASRGSSHPLLAAPTHRSGWIDPLVLAQRLARSEQIDDDDLAQALLRLPPSTPVSVAARLAGWDLAAMWTLRAALGDRTATPPSSPTLPASWDSVACLRGANLRMETPYETRVVWTPGTPTPERPVAVVGSPARTLTAAAPVDTFPGDPALRRWLTLVWPGDPEPYFAYALANRQLARFAGVLHMRPTERGRISPALEPMLTPDTPLGSDAYALLATALGAEPDDRILAAEVVAETIVDRRLDSERLGHAIATVARDPDAVPDRWAAALTDVPSTSALHAHETQRILETTLAGLGATVVRSPRLIDLLRRVAVDGDARISDERARSWLAAHEGSSKSARAARAVLAVEGNGAARSAAAAVVIEQYEARRSERWGR